MTADSKDLKKMTAVAERAVGLAIKAGAKQADALLDSGTEFRSDVLGGKVENLKQAQRRGLGLRVIVDGRVAIVYTSDFREDALRDLAARGVVLARQSGADEFAGLPEGALALHHDPAAMGLWDETVATMPAERKIDMAIEMERIVLGADARIKRTDGCSVTTQTGFAHLASSRGGSLAYRGTSIGMFVNPLAEDEGGRQQSGGYGATGRSLGAIETPEQMAREAARRAVARLGARPVPTQTVPVIMHPEVAARWLGSFFSAFEGDDVFRKTSYLTEKLGETIASPLITVVDDGVMQGGLATAPFDGEGQRTRRNVLIEKGACRMFVYDSYWARKAGAESTGNAGRSYQGSPGISNRNLYLERGTSHPEAIMKAVNRGFFLTGTGAFGYNPTTGAYSYAASGFWIEKGAIAHPVQDVTVASTTLDMLKNVTMVGDDLRFRGSVNAPTLLISAMTISGKG
jgi:PmbA protein